MPINSTSYPHAHFASFQTDKQRQSLATRSKEAVEEANDEALQEAIALSLADRKFTGDGFTEEQHVARVCGDAELINLTNEEALHRGLAMSLQETEIAPRPARSLVSKEEINAQTGLIQRFKQTLQNLGFKVWENAGLSNNCLIVSILQHVTDNHRSEHTEKANHYKNLLVSESGGTEQLDSSLYSDNAMTDWLVNQINRDYFGNNREAYFKFEFVTPGIDGEPSTRIVGDGQQVGIILDGAGHYEAVTHADGHARAQELLHPPK